MNASSNSTAQKLLAISGPLALIVFLVLGLVFHAWAIAWVAFLVPGMIRTWMAVEAPKEQHGYGIGADDEPKPYPYSDDPGLRRRRRVSSATSSACRSAA